MEKYKRACYNSIWSWSPMPCEKDGPRASVTTKTSAFGLGFCLLSPSGHVFHTAWETMIKSYNIKCQQYHSVGIIYHVGKILKHIIRINGQANITVVGVDLSLTFHHNCLHIFIKQKSEHTIRSHQTVWLSFSDGRVTQIGHNQKPWYWVCQLGHCLSWRKILNACTISALRKR